jgi:hypothetical protein
MKIFKILRQNLTHYSFGSVAAIITNTALIIALYHDSTAKTAVIGSLLVIALADNISDTFGIHIYRESENASLKEVWASTLLNFTARLITSVVFILIVLFADVMLAKTLAILYGLIILSGISFIIAKNKKINPKIVIFEHIIIAVSVIFISRFLNELITKYFLK